MTTNSTHDQDTANAVEYFKNHVIRRSGEDRWLLMKPYPDGKGYDSNLWVEIVILEHGGLLVTGDIDPVIFRYFSGPKQVPDDRNYQLSILRWMGRDQGVTSYMTEKACIGLGTSDSLKSFSYTAAEKDCDEYRDEYIAENLLDGCLEYTRFPVDIWDQATRIAFAQSIKDPSIIENWKVPKSLREKLAKRVLLDSNETMKELFEALNVSLKDILEDLTITAHEDKVCQAWLEAKEEACEYDNVLLFNSYLHDILASAGLQDAWECVGSIGSTYSPHLYYAWAAIRRLLEILEAEDVEEEEEETS